MGALLDVVHPRRLASLEELGAFLDAFGVRRVTVDAFHPTSRSELELLCASLPSRDRLVQWDDRSELKVSGGHATDATLDSLLALAKRCTTLRLTRGTTNLWARPDGGEVLAHLPHEVASLFEVELHEGINRLADGVRVELDRKLAFASLHAPDHHRAFAWFRVLAPSGDITVHLSGLDDGSEAVGTIVSLGGDVTAELTLDRVDALALAKGVPDCARGAFYGDHQRWALGGTDIARPGGVIETALVVSRSDFDAQKAAWLASIDHALEEAGL
jgi:hypothetical protein